MPLKQPSRRPSLYDGPLVEWIDRRADMLDVQHPEKAPHLRGQQFISMVGQNPTTPKVDKANLARAFDISRGAVYRWLDKLQQEHTA